ncbi:hypothetical protein [Thiocapsa rosea]|uniref:Uncharacterized protein n=1 Tax=Thiocapsa rosea TaxID=69360 RepID=A0A495V820_9GAMM|nr:hypothetical protein [Thiocapsa rosea]RKT45536.1 hypothetical protein BDD21_2997 [Thiocapsa rosea]
MCESKVVMSPSCKADVSLFVLTFIGRRVKRRDVIPKKHPPDLNERIELEIVGQADGIGIEHLHGVFTAGVSHRTLQRRLTELGESLASWIHPKQKAERRVST